MKQTLRNLFRSLGRNRTAQFILAAGISGALGYGLYAYLIREMYDKRMMLENRIATNDTSELRRKNEALKKEKKRLMQEYKTVKAEFAALETTIYKTHYPIVLDILDKINAFAFNIREYKLEPGYKRMSVTLVGSYQNLIRFIDFLGTIPADVRVEAYRIELTQNHMLSIKLTIEVTTVRI